MPQVIKVGAFVVFFWLDEGRPLGPVHVQVAEGLPRANATKIWLTQSGKTILANRHSEIRPVELRTLLRVIEANADLFREKWLDYLGEMRYFC